MFWYAYRSCNLPTIDRETQLRKEGLVDAGGGWSWWRVRLRWERLVVFKGMVLVGERKVFSCQNIYYTVTGNFAVDNFASGNFASGNYAARKISSRGNLAARNFRPADILVMCIKITKQRNWKTKCFVFMLSCFNHS